MKLKVGYKIVKNSEGKLVVIKETPEEQKVRLSSVQAPAFIPILHEVAATVRPIREYAENDPEMRGYEKFIPAAQLGNIIGKMAKRILLGTPEETDKLMAINKKVMNNEPLTEEEKKLSMNTNMMAVMDMATPTVTKSGSSGLDDIIKAQNIKNAGKDLNALIQKARIKRPFISDTTKKIDTGLINQPVEDNSVIDGFIHFNKNDPAYNVNEQFKRLAEINPPKNNIERANLMDEAQKMVRKNAETGVATEIYKEIEGAYSKQMREGTMQEGRFVRSDRSENIDNTLEIMDSIKSHYGSLYEKTRKADLEWNFKKLTGQDVKYDDLPNKIKVFRGGNVNEAGADIFTLDENIAKKFGKVNIFEVNKSDIPIIHNNPFLSEYEVTLPVSKVSPIVANKVGGVQPRTPNGRYDFNNKLTSKDILESKLKELTKKEIKFTEDGRFPPMNMKDKKFYDKLMTKRARLLGQRY